MPKVELNENALPKHVGIIMDGNGRWAKKRLLPRTAGHKVGVEVARNIMTYSYELGIKYLTLYTFSTENWKRSKEEVEYLMDLLYQHIKKEKDFYKKQNIRFLHAGDISKLSPELQKEIQDLIEESKNNTGLTLILAINYGGRDELVRAFNKAIENGDKNITEENINEYLDNPSVPDADLIIRTGGEKRLSNFLMWQSVYSEFEFIDVLWPDYSKKDFYNSLLSFQEKNRRFGGVIEEEEKNEQINK